MLEIVTLYEFLVFAHESGHYFHSFYEIIFFSGGFTKIVKGVVIPVRFLTSYSKLYKKQEIIDVIRNVN